ncbi:MAG: molybdenum cofactor biosysynthesis protein [Xanthomonadales bacterium]|nr:molybdenum cofactor biosysynthesis protein [Xanthomonadales bacterium]
MPTIDIQNIFIAPAHGFIGQDPEAAEDHGMHSVQQVECVAGSGLRGDRFFDYKDNYKGQATFFSAEVFTAALEHVGAANRPPWAMRRNIMVAGVDLNTLIGREFEIGGVRFFGTEECAPCRWMNRAIGAGAREFLKGRGGLRARILASGRLACGANELKLLA